jgi:hypothetical protein
MPTISINGLPVKDGRRTLVLQITQADIAAGQSRKPDCCAAAQACVNHLKVLEARVHLSRIYLRFDDKQWFRYETPLPLRQEIIAFDRGGKFEPLDVKLKPCPASERIGASRKSGPRLTKGKKREPMHHVTNVRGRAGALG